jgi:hypothetical protein
MTAPRTTATAVTSRSPRPGRTARGARVIAAVYFALAIVGGAGTWYYNLIYTGGNYLGDWFANAASSSAAVDILVVLVVTSVFYIREGRRLGWRLPLVLLFIPLSALVAVAFAFPLFLGLRELQLARSGRPTA